MNTPQREMTLFEYLEQLPSSHRARREFDAMQKPATPAPAPDLATSEPARARCFARHPQGRTFTEIERACDACAGEVAKSAASREMGEALSVVEEAAMKALLDSHHCGAEEEGKYCGGCVDLAWSLVRASRAATPPSVRHMLDQISARAVEGIRDRVRGMRVREHNATPDDKKDGVEVLDEVLANLDLFSYAAPVRPVEGQASVLRDLFDAITAEPGIDFDAVSDRLGAAMEGVQDCLAAPSAPQEPSEGQFHLVREFLEQVPHLNGCAKGRGRQCDCGLMTSARIMADAARSTRAPRGEPSEGMVLNAVLVPPREPQVIQSPAKCTTCGARTDSSMLGAGVDIDVCFACGGQMVSEAPTVAAPTREGTSDA